VKQKIIILYTAVVIFLIFLTSCLTPGSNTTTAPSNRETQGIGARDLGPEDVVTVDGRIDFRDPEYRGLLSTAPIGGKPSFFVTVTRMYNRDEEYEMGRRMLARQAAIYRRVRVQTKNMTLSTGDYVGNREQVEIEYDKSSLPQLMDEIKIVEFYQDNDGSYFKGVLENGRLPSFDFAREITDDRPVWLRKEPELPGYATAVGVSQRQMFFSTSLLKSEEQTLAAMARQFNVGVKRERTDIEMESIGTGYQQKSLEQVDVFLKGFYVIDRWISEDGNTYYSLAVCPIP